MLNIKPWVVMLVAVALAGCSMGPVTKGTLIGAASGAALGAGTGVLISDPDLWGSSDSKASGNISLDAGPTTAAGAAVGVIFGAIVGAMIGHGQDDGDTISEAAPPPEPQAQAAAVPVAF
jgi:hypothetical protein